MTQSTPSPHKAPPHYSSPFVPSLLRLEKSRQAEEKRKSLPSKPKEPEPAPVKRARPKPAPRLACGFGRPMQTARYSPRAWQAAFISETPKVPADLPAFAKGTTGTYVLACRYMSCVHSYAWCGGGGGGEGRPYGLSAITSTQPTSSLTHTLSLSWPL